MFYYLLQLITLTMETILIFIAFICKIERICDYLHGGHVDSATILPISDTFDLSRCKDFDLDKSIFIKNYNLKYNNREAIQFNKFLSSFELEQESKVCDIV